MSEDITLMIIWLGFFASVFLGWHFYLKARNKERMALIEKDKDVSEIYSKREIRFKFPWLKLGMLMTGIGLGFCLAIALILSPGTGFKFHGADGPTIAIGFTLLFGGIFMVISYYMERRKDN